MTPILRALDLFAGAGGLSLALERAGFVTEGVEWDEAACATHNAGAGSCLRADVRTVSPKMHVALVAGGFPCQIYSQAQSGACVEAKSKRLFPECFRIAKEARARAVMFENVRGLLLCKTEDGEPVIEAVIRSAREHGYYATYKVLDAADYGVPQHRRRLFIVGFHTRAMLDRFVYPTPLFGPGLEDPWVTVEDIFPVIPYPFPSPTVLTAEHSSARHDLHVLQSNPRRALERMRKYLRAHRPGFVLDTPPPSALGVLQGFPEDYPWQGTPTEQYRQIGNAVPPLLGQHVAGAVRRVLLGEWRGE